MPHLNIGILAHIDAGKTSLTERLLHHAGVIDRVGRVDTGDTQTDTLDTERRRGITIRSAVVSFAIGDVRVNLVDTPGHPDFIAEVERALCVLDGVVLVVSAVEGVQAQTRVLLRAVRRQGIPVVLFANKIDRAGARYDSLLAELGSTCVPLSVVSGIGTPAARSRPVGPSPELLAEHSDDFLAAYLHDAQADARAELVRQTGLGMVSPVFFGSARTGDGVAELAAGIREFLPAKPLPDNELRATVFKVERGRAREKIAYVRMFSGELGARDHVPVHRASLTFEQKVTSVRVFEQGANTVEARAGAGRIAEVLGLKDVQIGDHIGLPAPAGTAHFPPPGLETVVRPVRPDDAPVLFAALQELAEEDPLITVRQHDEITVRLYGEVQKEVLEEMLAVRHGIAVEFSATRPVHVRRVTGTGESVWEIGDGRNPHFATVGLRVAPGNGLMFELEAEFGALPPSFHKAIEETAMAALADREVVDCTVTVTRTGYLSPISTAGDFRKVTPLVLDEALRRAGTELLEPVSGFELELPADTVNATLSRLVDLGALVTESAFRGDRAELAGTLPAARVRELEQQLPGLSRGEGVVSTRVSGYQPVGSSHGHRRQ